MLPLGSSRGPSMIIFGGHCNCGSKVSGARAVGTEALHEEEAVRRLVVWLVKSALCDCCLSHKAVTCTWEVERSGNWNWPTANCQLNWVCMYPTAWVNRRASCELYPTVVSRNS